MELVTYDPDTHFGTLCRILYERQAYIPYRAEMPEIGVAVHKGREVVAMGFIRRIEGGYGQIDGLTTNPVSSSEDRNEAISLTLLALIDKAKELGIKQLLAMTLHDNIVERAVALGCTEVTRKTVILDLNSKAK